LVGKNREKKRAIIAVNLTETEKNGIEKFVIAWGIDMAAIARRLVQVLLGGKVTLPELLRKYRETPVSKEITSQSSELRIHRIGVRLSQKEKEELTILANGAFYRPSEFVRILLLLLVMGIMEPTVVNLRSKSRQKHPNKSMRYRN
jgi:hypothetical protein